MNTLSSGSFARNSLTFWCLTRKCFFLSLLRPLDIIGTLDMVDPLVLPRCCQLAIQTRARFTKSSSHLIRQARPDCLSTTTDGRRTEKSTRGAHYAREIMSPNCDADHCQGTLPFKNGEGEHTTATDSQVRANTRSEKGGAWGSTQIMQFKERKKWGDTFCNRLRHLAGGQNNFEREFLNDVFILYLQRW